MRCEKVCSAYIAYIHTLLRIGNNSFKALRLYPAFAARIRLHVIVNNYLIHAEASCIKAYLSVFKREVGYLLAHTVIADMPKLYTAALCDLRVGYLNADRAVLARLELAVAVGDSDVIGGCSLLFVRNVHCLGSRALWHHSVKRYDLLRLLAVGVKLNALMCQLRLCLLT